MAVNYLGLMDVAGIQDYLSKESRLAYIADASAYVENMSAADGLFEAVTGNLPGAEMIVAAGGVAAYRSADRSKIEKVLQTISYALLKDGNGLEIVGAIYEYNEGQLAQIYGKAQTALERKKYSQPRSTRFMFSGLAPKPPHRPSSKPPSHDVFVDPSELDDMIGEGFWLRKRQGGTEETEEKVPENVGLMAVVSIDGLQMGKKMFRWLDDARERELPDSEFVTEFRNWSNGLKRRWQSAWDYCVNEIDAVFAESDSCIAHPGNSMRKLALKSVRGPDADQSAGGSTQWHRPIRRIYQGGDDMSFVADARIALAVAVMFMKSLESEPNTDAPIHPLFQHVTASCGIVFVDAHFPFSRARLLADNVRNSAKKQSVSEHGDAAPSCIDWWVNRNGSYERSARQSTMLPCLLKRDGAGSDTITWPGLEACLFKMWAAFEPRSMNAPSRSDAAANPPAADESNSGEDMKGRRNKLKAIIRAAEIGPGAVHRLLSVRPLSTDKSGSLEWPAFLPDGHNHLTGFNPEGTRTVILDAGEIYDIHFPLVRGAAAAGGGSEG